MRITSVKYTPIYVPFKGVFQWRFGLRRGISCVIIEVETDEGIVGLGEVDYLGPWMEQLLRDITPHFLGQDPFAIEVLCNRLYSQGFVYWADAVAYPLCGIEMALWDVVGKAVGQPLYKLWGGKTREQVSCVAYIGYRHPSEIGEAAQAYVDKGFSNLKIKLGVDRRFDIEEVKEVRNAIGYGVELRADANQAWTPMTAIRQINKLEAYDLQYVEQPVPRWDLDGLAVVKKSVRTPIAACESNYNMYDAYRIVQKGAASILLVDPKRAGGLHRARKSFAVAEAAGLPVGFHGGAELSIANAAKIHLALATPGFMYAMDSLYHWCAEDVVTEPLCYQAGSLTVPDRPGIGMTLDPDKLAHCAEAFKANPPKSLWGLEDPGWKRDIPNY